MGISWAGSGAGAGSAAAACFLFFFPISTRKRPRIPGPCKDRGKNRRHPLYLQPMETQTEHKHETPSSQPQTPVRLTDRAAAMVKETIERENLAGSGLRV